MASKIVARVSPKQLKACIARANHRGYSNAAAAAAAQQAPQDQQRRGIRKDVSPFLPFGVFDIWEPRSLRQMLDTIDRYVDSPAAFPAALGGVSPRTSMRTPWDIVEKPEAFIIRVDMPGLDKSEVSIGVEDEELVIRGERKAAEGDVFGDSRSYNTRMVLPKEVDKGSIKAELKNGVLIVVVPKIKPEAKKVTQIQVS
ncbi:small heat shock protein, chloroplastic [Selaginella moellendorffii]|uniref:small heat shock protein, chloroplastic n=1 Tax=Selaginella moellendorffii TaxID=88036 RepID=UPI000D1CEACD|nr:small heat shock protein, chloroplastic [Selaginella moellendorffii]|eukprot:XP_002974726.2 small heat shock protein, chloroplastic [Selaginella moellendorffii]